MNENLALKIRKKKREKNTQKSNENQVDNMKLYLNWFFFVCECYLQCDIMMQRCEHNYITI